MPWRLQDSQYSEREFEVVDNQHFGRIRSILSLSVK